MKSNLPKVMHALAGKPMISHVVSACEDIMADKILIVTAPNMDSVRDAVAPYQCVHQISSLGTGDAVKAAQEALEGFQGNVMVLFGDTPLVTKTTLEKLVQKQKENDAAIIVGCFTPQDPAAYGRLVLDANGMLESIVEKADATEEQLNIITCNGGIMLFDSAVLWKLIGNLENKNAKGEYYLTDCIALGKKMGSKIMVAELDTQDILGINNRVQLAEGEKAMQRRLRETAMLAGVTMHDPDSIFLCTDTKFGRDVTLESHIVFGPNVTIADNVEIRAFSYIEGATIESGAIIGPFARLRNGAKIGSSAHIGNFVEIKNSVVGKGAKANHLSYIGDASVGESTNIGAGTITCNYDGYNKFKTEIGAGVFVGSNTSLVAPVKIGDGALIAAGSIITKDVPAEALALARSEQKNMTGSAERFRKKQGEVKNKN